MPNQYTDYGFDMNAFLESYNQSILGNLGGQQNNSSVLRGFFPLSNFPGLTDADLSKYSSFIGQIPQELYELIDPDSDYYRLQREERVGFLQGDINTSLAGNLDTGQEGLFQTSREARGMQGRRGFVQGRDFMKNVRIASNRAQEQKGRELSETYSKGLYSINEDIIRQLEENQRYVAGLEAEQRRTALQIGKLGEFFDDDDDEDDTNLGTQGWIPGLTSPSFNFNDWSMYNPYTYSNEGDTGE